MFSAASKLYFSVASVAIIAGFVLVAATGDRSGWTLLVWTGAIAAGLGIAAFALIPADPVPPPATADADSAPPATRPVDAADVARPSAWPLAAAVAMGVVAASPAVGKGLLFIGVLLGSLVAIGWLAQVWREHPSWTPEMTARLNDRFVVPIALPGTILLLIGVGVIAFSRVLLATPKEVATGIALVVAVAILLACAYVASRPRMGTAALGSVATFAAVSVIAAGIAGAVKGEREFEAHGGGGVHLVAENLAFDTEELDLPAGAAVTLEFENLDENIQHNVAIYTERGGEALFEGKLFPGIATEEYEVPALSPGSYWFQCDVHPNMNGEVIVSDEASKPGEEGNEPTTQSTTEH